ncbi:unnamed protein product [Urochloa humidicola]
MERYRQGSSASSNPTANLEAFLHAMRLGDPSSSASHLQPQHHAAIPPLLLNHHHHHHHQQQQQVLAPPPHMFRYPPQALLPTATPGMWRPPPPPMLQYPAQELLRPTAPPDMRLNYFGGEGFNVNPPAPSFNVPAAPTPLAAPGPINPSTSAQEYRPNSRSTSALLRALLNGADPLPSTQTEVRSRLVQGQMVPALVMSAESSPHVVHLLAEGDAGVRRGVLAGIRHVVHRVMKDNVAGYAVFLELLRACDGKHEELKVIIDAVCNGTGVLIDVFDEEYLGRKALEELIKMMARNCPLCDRLILGLLEKERLLQKSSGCVVLRHCFNMLPYEDCSLIITYAVGNIDEVLFSPYGWRSLAECFENAQGDDLKNLEAIVLTRTSEIAKGEWSAGLLRYLLWSESDREHLKSRIVDRVAADILDLSMDKFGCRMVDACFLGTKSREALPRLLNALLSLHRSQLQALVLDWCSNIIVRKVLLAGKDSLPELTRKLAFRIEGLGAEMRKQDNAKLVLRLIYNLFPFGEAMPL